MKTTIIITACLITAIPIVEGKTTYYFFVNPVRPAALSRSGWTFNATSEEKGGEGPVNGYITAALDDDTPLNPN